MLAYTGSPRLKQEKSELEARPGCVNQDLFQKNQTNTVHSTTNQRKKSESLAKVIKKQIQEFSVLSAIYRLLYLYIPASSLFMVKSLTAISKFHWIVCNK